MTPRQVLTVDFSEINKIEITCLKCGAALVLPVPHANTTAFVPPIHYTCPGCNEVLWSGENDQRLIRILGLLRSLGFWKELKNPGFNLSFSLDSN
jgi:uncharacterized protein with PIN domain